MVFFRRWLTDLVVLLGVDSRHTPENIILFPRPSHQKKGTQIRRCHEFRSNALG